MKTHILLIEQDSFFSKIAKRVLEEDWGMSIFVITDEAKAGAEVGTGRYDAVILNYHENTSEEIIKAIRNADQLIPIVFYSPTLYKEQILKAFSLGADIELCQPFEFEELYLRLKRMLLHCKIVKKKEQIKYTIGSLIFNYSDMQLVDLKSNLCISLPCREADLLKYFCEHKNEEMRREEILAEVWGATDFFTGRTMDVYLVRIRKHIGLVDNVKLVTIHGRGLVLQVA